MCLARLLAVLLQLSRSIHPEAAPKDELSPAQKYLMGFA